MDVERKPLSDGEKAALRLLAQGHDAKSAARELGLSVHAINERLRTARRKLGVSSSREAARLLAGSEPAWPNSLVDNKIEVVGPERAGEARFHDSKGRRSTYALAVGGIITVSLVIMIAMFAAVPSQTAASGPLPNWSLQAALPAQLSQPPNRIHLTGNRLLWNGNEVSEADVRAFLAVVANMSPQPLTILSYGPHVVPGRTQHLRELVDGVLHCKPETCLEVTAPVDDGSAPHQ